MNFVCVCRCCGRTINQEFLYCPWCGKEKVPENDDYVFENVMRQLEEKQIDGRNRRLIDIKNRLNDLEHDLDYLVLNAESHK